MRGKLVRCDICGKKKYHPPGKIRKNKHNYCGKDCMYKGNILYKACGRKRTGTYLKCEICRKEYYCIPAIIKRRKYCSIKCSYIGHSKNMIKIYNLKDKIFGRLTVLRRMAQESQKKGRSYWECICECGGKAFVDTAHLKNGHVQSCGCLRKERAEESQTRNLLNRSGQRYGRLTVIERMPKIYKNNGTRNYVKCKCDCGNEVIIWISSLTRGYTTSCGCYAEACLMTRHSICLGPEDIPMEMANTRRQIGKIDRYIKERIR